MKKRKASLGILFLLPFFALAGYGFAQSAPAAAVPPGLVHFTEGKVFLNNDALEQKGQDFPIMKEGDVLETKDGRAEILLLPGIFLRIDENSMVRLVSSRLLNIRFDIVWGAALLECLEFPKYTEITFTYSTVQVQPKKKGLYRLDAKLGLCRVYDGEAVATSAFSAPVRIKGGRQFSFFPAGNLVKFDKKHMDDLAKWSYMRAEFIARASSASVNIIFDYGTLWMMDGWFWNPYFGSYAFIPYNRMLRSFYGFQYYSPQKWYQTYRTRSPSVSQPNASSKNQPANARTRPSDSSQRSPGRPPEVRPDSSASSSRPPDARPPASDPKRPPTKKPTRPPSGRLLTI